MKDIIPSNQQETSKTKIKKRKTEETDRKKKTKLHT